MVQDPTKIDDILSGICASNDDKSNINDSQARDIVEIRCILMEARNAISADAANTAIQLIEAADKCKSSPTGIYHKKAIEEITNEIYYHHN